MPIKNPAHPAYAALEAQMRIQRKRLRELERQNLVLACVLVDVLRAHGATPDPDYLLQPSYWLPTRAGRLHVWVEAHASNQYGATVFLKFENVALARQVFCGINDRAFNPASGKWNHPYFHHDAVSAAYSLGAALARVTCTPVQPMPALAL